MTWSISVSAPNKADAKLEVTLALAQFMVSSQKPHARDFAMAHGAIHAAIDACAEGQVSVSANGYLNGNWVDGDIPTVTGVCMNMNVYSTPPAEAPQA